MSNRKFGLEIEYVRAGNRAVSDALNAAGIECVVEGYNHQTRRHWKIVTDASVAGGYELVSPPLKFGDESFAQVTAACTAAESVGANVNKSCGIHVHHDASDFTPSMAVSLVKSYYRNRRWIDTFMPQSRRAAACRWAQTPRYSEEALDRCTDMRSVYRAAGNTRYVAVNVASYFTHGTIEFRQHSGSVEAAKILHWIRLTNAMMEKAAAGEEIPACNSLEEFLSHLLTVSGAEASDIRRPKRGPKPGLGGVAGLAYTMIAAGRSDQDIIDAITARFPDSQTTVKGIRTYRSRARAMDRYNEAMRAARHASGTAPLLPTETRDYYLTRANSFGAAHRAMNPAPAARRRYA